MTTPNSTNAPAGWYDDGTGTGTQRYWDGSRWTDAVQPAGTTAAGTAQATPGGSNGAGPGSAAPPKERNVLGIVALVVAVVGFIFACIPGALVVGWVLLPIAFVLAIVALFLRGRGKGLAIAALITSIVGTVVGFVVFFAVVANSFDNAFGGRDADVKAPAGASASASEPAAASAQVGTRDNPAPLGSEIVGTDFTVKVNSVNLNATDAVLAANQFNEAPDAGTVYALVNATVTYTGKDSSYAAEVQISYVGADGKVYNSFDKNVVGPEPSLGADELYTGASATGNLVIQIPASADGLLRVQPGLVAKKVFVATK